MTSEQKAAFINAQCTCAMIERAAMTWQNNKDIQEKRPPRYGYGDFMELQEKYLIGHNQVVEFFR